MENGKFEKEIIIPYLSKALDYLNNNIEVENNIMEV